MNQAPFFNAQFFDDDGLPLVGGLLWTYASGTTTPATTYENEAGDTPNTNPIVLDAAGRCDLWLTPGTAYGLLLLRSDDTLVRRWDDVVGAAESGVAVTSVAGRTGAIVLTADDIGFTTATTTEWFVGSDVTAALDAIITQVDTLNAGSVTLTASGIPIVDAGGLLTATNVETALAEIATTAASALPSQTSNSGKFLTTNGTAASWAAVALSAFTVSITGGNISVSVAAGLQPYGTRSAAVTGGTAPYSYAWLGLGPDMVLAFSAGAASSTNISGQATAATVTGSVICLVTDATGRMTSAQITFSAVHAA